MALHGKVFRSGTDSQWYFEVVAANGEIISASEGYENKGDAVDIVYEILGEDAEVTVLGDPAG